MNRFSFSDRMFFAGILLALSTGIVPAQSTPDPSTKVDRPTLDRRFGEEEQIKRRREWFFSTRTTGAATADERAQLRREAVKQTKTAMELQHSLRS